MLIKKLFLMALFLLGSLPPAMAAQPAPAEPPIDNPHPAVSEADKKRVAFAELVIKHLQTPQDPLQEKSSIDFRTKVQLNISEKCLLSAECLNQTDKNGYLKIFKAQFGTLNTYKHVHIIPWSFEKFQNQQSVKSQAVTKPTPEVVVREKKSELAEISSEEMRAPKGPTARSKFRAEDVENMVVPEVLPGEYMIHSYVLFDGKIGWYHLNIIVSEDENGELKLQRLYSTPLPQPSIRMPKGVVC